MAPYSLIIPALNEERGLRNTLERVQALSEQPELIVVNDGSTDRTQDIAQEYGAHVLTHAIPRGYGFSLKEGIRSATNDLVVITDADGTYPIERIPDLLQAMRPGVDMVVGARTGKAYWQSMLKAPARVIFAIIVEYVSGQRVPDINSGLRVFRRSTATRYLPDICNGFSFTTTITIIYLLTGKSIVFVPIEYAPRIGRSKVRIIRDSIRTLQYIIECIVRYNPLKLFLALIISVCIFGAFASLWLGIPALFFTGLTATILAALGFVAEALRRHHRE